MIHVEHVTHGFGGRPVLNDVTLTLDERRIGVVGGNGSGKSTFARLLNGLLVPEAGRVVVDGLDTRSDARAVRRRVGFVFQDPDTQIVLPIVEDDLAFGLRNLGYPKAEIRLRVDRTLERHGLTPLRHHPAHALSGGQKQILAICAVLIMNPQYVVFDEPTTLLDLRHKRSIARLIEELPQTAIVVSHDLDLLCAFDRIVVFDDGRVVADGPPDATLARYVESMS